MCLSTLFLKALSHSHFTVCAYSTAAIWSYVDFRGKSWRKVEVNTFNFDICYYERSAFNPQKNYEYITQRTQKHRCTIRGSIICLFVCLFVCLLGVFHSPREFFTHMETWPFLLKAANVDLYSKLMAFEQWGFFSVPHLLCQKYILTT